MNRPGLQVTLPSDREIVLTRDFDAPRRLVFDAWSKPELLTRWLGVHNGWTLAVCEVDLKVGGSYRYVWRGPDGTEMGMRGIYQEIQPPERVVTSEQFDQAWYEGACIGTMTLTERAGKTTMTMTLRYDSKAIRDAVLQSPMKEGMEAGFAMLDTVLAGSGAR